MATVAGAGVSVSGALPVAIQTICNKAPLPPFRAHKKKTQKWIEWETKSVCSTARTHLLDGNENAALRKIAPKTPGNQVASGKWKLKSNGLLGF